MRKISGSRHTHYCSVSMTYSNRHCLWYLIHYFSNLLPVRKCSSRFFQRHNIRLCHLLYLEPSRILYAIRQVVFWLVFAIYCPNLLLLRHRMFHRCCLLSFYRCSGSHRSGRKCPRYSFFCQLMFRPKRSSCRILPAL